MEGHQGRGGDASGRTKQKRSSEAQLFCSAHIQRSAKVLVRGLVKFVPALAKLAGTSFTKPRTKTLADLCNPRRQYGIYSGFEGGWGWDQVWNIIELFIRLSVCGRLVVHGRSSISFEWITLGVLYFHNPSLKWKSVSGRDGELARGGVERWCTWNIKVKNPRRKCPFEHTKASVRSLGTVLLHCIRYFCKE